MAYLTNCRDGKRFLGHRETREVHDLNREIPGPAGCGIRELLKSGQAVGFIIDHLNQAQKENYRACAKCIGPAIACQLSETK